MIREKNTFLIDTYRAEWFLKSHQVNNKCTTRNEKDFHKSVVQGNVIHEEIDVSHTENNQIYFLSFA